VKLRNVYRSRQVLFGQILSVVLMVGITYLYAHQIDSVVFVSFLKGADWKILMMGYLLGLAVFVFRGFRWGSLLKLSGVFLGRLNAFLMVLVDVFFATLVSSLSPIVRGMYLGNRVAGITEKLRLLFIDKMFDWIIPGSLALISFPYLVLRWPNGSIWLSWLVLLFALPFGVYWGFRLLEGLKERSWLRGLDWVRVKILPYNPIYLGGVGGKEITKIFLFSLLGFVAYYLSMYTLSVSFSLPITLAQLIMIDAISTFAVLVPINFVGFGTRDIAIVGLLTFYGCPPEPIALYIIALVTLRIFLAGMGWGSMVLLHRRGYTLEWRRDGNKK